MSMETMYEWANEMNCAVTVCDTEGIILYMKTRRHAARLPNTAT